MPPNELACPPSCGRHCHRHHHRPFRWLFCSSSSSPLLRGPDDDNDNNCSRWCDAPGNPVVRCCRSCGSCRCCRATLWFAVADRPCANHRFASLGVAMGDMLLAAAPLVSVCAWLARFVEHVYGAATRWRNILVELPGRTAHRQYRFVSGRKMRWCRLA